MNIKTIQKPLVTVIVPSYNSPDLYGALRSVVVQDYELIQLVVIDDGSDNFSCESVEKFLQRECRENIKSWIVLSNTKNMGTVYSINYAIEFAKGEYIFNLAGDDEFFDCHVLSDWVDAFRTTGAQVMTAMRAVYDETLSIRKGLAPTQKQIRYLKKLSSNELFEKIVPENFIFGCCTARSMASLLKYGKFDERYRLIEDHSMNLRLLREGEKIVFYDRIVVKYRGGGASSAGRYNTDYEKDVDLIYENEILPFTQYPVLARRAQWQWKRDQKLGRKYQRLKEKISGKPALAILWLWYRLHHPWRTLCRIPEKMIEHLLKGD